MKNDDIYKIISNSWDQIVESGPEEFTPLMAVSVKKGVAGSGDGALGSEEGDPRFRRKPGEGAQGKPASGGPANSGGEEPEGQPAEEPMAGDQDEIPSGQPQDEDAPPAHVPAPEQDEDAPPAEDESEVDGIEGTPEPGADGDAEAVDQGEDQGEDPTAAPEIPQTPGTFTDEDLTIPDQNVQGEYRHEWKTRTKAGILKIINRGSDAPPDQAIFLTPEENFIKFEVHLIKDGKVEKKEDYLISIAQLSKGKTDEEKMALVINYIREENGLPPDEALASPVDPPIPDPDEPAR